MNAKSQALIARLIQPRFIQLHLTARTAVAAIHELTGLLAGHPAITDLTQLDRAIVERQQVMPSLLGNAVAFPHARTGAVRDFAVAVGRSLDGVPFGHHATPARLLLLLASPNGRVPDHLAVVSALARRLTDADARTKLLAANSPEAFAQILVATQRIEKHPFQSE